MSNSSSSVFIASTEIGDADPVPRQLVAAQQTDFGTAANLIRVKRVGQTVREAGRRGEKCP